MPSLSSKAQFFILTTVVIVGVFYTLSKYINPYAFVDTSKAAVSGETFFFDNVKEKAIKTVKLSNSGNLLSNLQMYKNYVRNLASEKGYNLELYYTNTTTLVNIQMVLTSEKYTLKSNFTVSY
ncbi:MAG: hypothetical protein AYK18_02890 [Theionarchaea archaeon DG-70]|nr:MAG: hypothetical protein AYK18_02890 [Theionarchaea archaeon DG-70]